MKKKKLTDTPRERKLVLRQQRGWFSTLGEGAVVAGEEECCGTGQRGPAWVLGREAGIANGTVLGAGDLEEHRPLGRIGDGACGDLVEGGVLDAADTVLAAALVPVLVQLVVDHLLDDNDDGTEKEGESDDTEVGLQIPLLPDEWISKSKFLLFIIIQEFNQMKERDGGTWKVRFLRSRALAWVRKLAGPREGEGEEEEESGGCMSSLSWFLRSRADSLAVVLNEWERRKTGRKEWEGREEGRNEKERLVSFWRREEYRKLESRN